MNLTQSKSKRTLMARRQPLSKTLQALVLKTWLRTMVQLSAISPAFIRLAELPLGPYKDKKQLLRYLNPRPYVSPRAQISCPDQLHLSPKCFIDDYVTIYAHKEARGGIYLAENAHIYRWSMVELGEGQGNLEIGANTYIQSGCVLNPFVSSIIIGANCMIAPKCAFMPYGHDFGDTSRPMREQPLISKGDIVLEDDVWLGVNVSVMDGVTIGQGAIVGAGAVVTKDIPPYTIAGGVPARVLRDRKPDDFHPGSVQGQTNGEK